MRNPLCAQFAARMWVVGEFDGAQVYPDVIGTREREQIEVTRIFHAEQLIRYANESGPVELKLILPPLNRPGLQLPTCSGDHVAAAVLLVSNRLLARRQFRCGQIAHLIVVVAPTGTMLWRVERAG